MLQLYRVKFRDFFGSCVSWSGKKEDFESMKSILSRSDISMVGSRIKSKYNLRIRMGMWFSLCYPGSYIFQPYDTDEFLLVPPDLMHSIGVFDPIKKTNHKGDLLRQKTYYKKFYEIPKGV